MKRVFPKIISIVIVAFMLAGCTAGPAEESVEELQRTANIEYEIPKSIPNVLVDQVGYETESTKIAIFRGENLQKTFEVIDAVSGETVYTGEIISEGYNEASDEYTSYGSFTELEKNGTYYIQTAVIGQSYPFVIGDKLYNELIPQISKNIYYNRCGMDIRPEYAQDSYVHKACHTEKVSAPDTEEKIDVTGGWHTADGYGKDVVEGCTIAANLLLTYEFYPNEITDDSGIPESENMIPDILDEVRYEIEWLLKMQNSKTGGVYGGIIDKADAMEIAADKDQSTQQLQEVTNSATAEFAGVMAQFYLSEKDYDETFARQCLGAAEKAWKYLEKNADGQEEYETPEQYYAAAQLYKVTGNVNYYKYISQYHVAEKEELQDENRQLYGDIAYLTTTKKVDTKLCSTIMDRWMNKAENIVEESKQNAYFVTGDTNTDMLSDMLCLAVIDHVITNHEYVTVLESHLHYILGRNSQGVSLIEGIGKAHSSVADARIEITKQPELTATLMFVLGEIITEDTRTEE